MERIEPHGVGQLLQRFGGSSDIRQDIGEPGVAFGLAGIERYRTLRPCHSIGVLTGAKMQHAERAIGQRQRRFERQRTAGAGKALGQLCVPLLRLPPPGHIEVLDIGDFRMSRCEARIERDRPLELLFGGHRRIRPRRVALLAPVQEQFVCVE